MMINALNSGANGLHGRLRGRQLADLGRTWSRARSTCIDAVERTISLRRRRTARATGSNDETATLLVRPRGWHLAEKHVLVDGEPISAQPLRLRPLLLPQRRRAARRAAPGRTSTCRSWRATSRRGSGTTSSAAPQDALGVPRGTIRATVLIETILAAFEMEEILYELRDHSAGLNAGRWDYIFSVIKKFRDRPDFVLPDRAQVTMTVAVHARLHRAAGQDLPRARRPRDRRHGGVHPRAGATPEVNETRAGARCARTRSARPATASTAPGSRTPTSSPIATRVFDRVLGDRPNQIERQREDVDVTRGRPAGLRRDAGRRSPRRRCARTSASASSTSSPGCAGIGAAAHQQPDGGRRDGRDLARRRSGSGCGTAGSPATTSSRIEREELEKLGDAYGPGPGGLRARSRWSRSSSSS